MLVGTPGLTTNFTFSKNPAKGKANRAKSMSYSVRACSKKGGILDGIVAGMRTCNLVANDCVSNPTKRG